jgi:hypothetical protein
MSVMINSSGHNNTPQVRLKERPDCPKMVKLAGDIPKTFSRENILPPIHSAINALATKKAAILINRIVGLSLSIL